MLHLKKIHTHLFLLLLLLILVTNALQAQEFFVLHVKGKIVNVSKNNADVVMGSKISPKDKLKFTSSDAFAIVMSKETGRKMIDGGKAKKEDSSELTAFVTDVLMPMKTNHQLSTRAILPAEIIDFEAYFGSEKFMIIGDMYQVEVSKTKYPLDLNRVVILKYEYDKRPVQKELLSKNNQIIFSKKDIYALRGAELNPDHVKNVELFYFDKQSKERTKLVEFKPVFVGEETLIKEINSLINFLVTNDIMKGEELKDELYKYALEVYGKTDSDRFAKWLHEKTQYGSKQ
jgi:hypothetical protein